MPENRVLMWYRISIICQRRRIGYIFKMRSLRTGVVEREKMKGKLLKNYREKAVLKLAILQSCALKIKGSSKKNGKYIYLQDQK